MIVVDASVVVDLLLRRAPKDSVNRLLHAEESLHAPHLLELEVTQVLRRYALIGALGEARADEALTDLRDLRLERYPHARFLPRIWELRHNLTAYDAAYVALAEALDAPLLTRDRRMASSPGHRATIELI